MDKYIKKAYVISLCDLYHIDSYFYWIFFNFTFLFKKLIIVNDKYFMYCIDNILSISEFDKFIYI